MPLSTSSRLRDRNSARKRFILILFVVGASFPTILYLVGFLLPIPNSVMSDHLGNAIHILAWIMWPTWFFMFDAEHAPTIVFMLLCSSAVDGALYAVVGFGVWYLFLSIGKIFGHVRKSA